VRLDQSHRHTLVRLELLAQRSDARARLCNKGIAAHAKHGRTCHRDAIDLRQRQAAVRVEDASSLMGRHGMTSTRYMSVTTEPGSAEFPDGLTSLLGLFFAVQRAQWDALLSWQESLATCGKDFWEEWAVRYAGGMPFDG
jgi:hypothetical protein